VQKVNFVKMSRDE